MKTVKMFINENLNEVIEKVFNGEKRIIGFEEFEGNKNVVKGIVSENEMGGIEISFERKYLDEMYKNGFSGGILGDSEIEEIEIGGKKVWMTDWME
jgi:hypothetical protein